MQSETTRIKLQGENKKFTKTVDLLVKEVEKCIALNNDMLEKVQILRKALSHKEVTEKNYKVD